MIPIPIGVKRSLTKYYKINIIETSIKRSKLKQEGVKLLSYQEIAKNHLHLHLIKLIMQESKSSCSMYIKGYLVKRRR